MIASAVATLAISDTIVCYVYYERYSDAFFQIPLQRNYIFTYNNDRIPLISEGLFSILKYVFGLLTTHSIQI